MARMKKVFVPRERIPKFKTEAEEAAWWDSHREMTAGWVRQARAAGALTSVESALDGIGVKAPSRVISIRLPESDLAAARRQASERGLPYQTYVKMLLHQALKQAKPA